MDFLSLLFSALLVTALIIGLWAYLKYSNKEVTSNSTDITTSAMSGMKEYKYSKKLPESYNQPKGIEFSYAGWIYVEDFTYKYGHEKIIFVKGSADMSVACPAIVLDGNTNTLLVKIDTYGAQEIFPVHNVPAKKWLHFAIAVSQSSVDIYINGTLKEHHTLSQLPRQNSGQLIVAPSGGFDGRVSSLKYFNYTLKPSDVEGLAKSAPIVTESENVMPPYFDASWYTSD